MVGRNLGADSLQRWLIGQGWACERTASAITATAASSGMTASSRMRRRSRRGPIGSDGAAVAVMAAARRAGGPTDRLQAWVACM